MRCPPAKRLAAASLGADPRAELHAETCERCRAELAAMAEIGAFARRAPVRTPGEDRKARIAALVMASADAAADVPARRSRMPVAMVAVIAGAAVAVFVWQARPEPAQYALAWPVLQVPPRAHVAAPPSARETAPVVVPAPAPVHASRPGGEPDATAVATSGPSGRPRAAAPSWRVFAGSQEHAEDPGMTREQITLVPPPRPPVVAPPFERGWTALREAHYADAIAAFDQASEPAVAEDAAYWAAIASARAGDRPGAVRRLTAFVAKFPGSARITDARSLLARLAP